MMDTKPPIVGIDLGTTHSLIAVLEDGVPRLIPNALGEVLTPSAVSWAASGEVLVGSAAAARARTHPAHTVRSFKRDMGTERSWDLGFGRVQAVELSALVLRTLREDAEAYLGRPVTEVVVTVPAYFGEAQRRATQAAAAIAGLRAERIINEPTAAALAYGLHRRDEEQRVAVVDLGGGTFDVTILEIMEGVLEVQATAGDIRLGGDDFVEALMPRVTDEHGAPRSGEEAARREAAVQRLVWALTEAEVAEERWIRDDGSPAQVRLRRDEAEATWQPLLGRLRSIVRRALRDASALPQAIDAVLLVGGASRMPCVAAAVGDFFGRPPTRALPPDEAIALGAAIQAGLKARDAAVSDLVVADIAPFSLGLEVVDGAPGQYVSGLFSPILHRGTPIPASRVERFHTADDGQRRVDIRVYQGEHPLCADNVLLGRLALDGLPRARAGAVQFDVRFTYDLNGILEVEANVVGSPDRVTVVLHRQGEALSEAFVADAQRKMARLKTHPRELLPNRTALDRADACYVDLLGAARAALGHEIARFLLALDSQDEAVIAAARDALNARVEASRVDG